MGQHQPWRDKDKDQSCRKTSMMKIPKLRTLHHLLLSLWYSLAVVSGESGAQLEEGGAAKASSPCLSDVHAVLREMSAQMAEQRVELRIAKARIEALETRLKARESAVDQVKTENQGKQLGPWL